jgi:hypothetical protein
MKRHATHAHLGRAIQNIEGTVRSVESDISSVRRQLARLRPLVQDLGLESFKAQFPKPESAVPLGVVPDQFSNMIHQAFKALEDARRRLTHACRDIHDGDYLAAASQLHAIDRGLMGRFEALQVSLQQLTKEKP